MPQQDADDASPSDAPTEKDAGRGRLTLFLGFAAGVGKTYQMLTEAHRLRRAGEDVAAGFVVTHGRKETEAQIGGLELIPPRQTEYKGAEFEEMDTKAILARRPQWVLVDELAHTNVPGSRHSKRYEDVMDILAAGIHVLTTMNVQHLESLSDTVQQITGIKVRETVPDWVLGEADEIVTVDITPRGLIERLERGDVYALEKVPAALANFFTEGNLSALRGLALREVAAEADRAAQLYREAHHVSETWKTQERVLVAISPDKFSDRLLRRGWRVARRLRAEIVAVYVSGDPPSLEQQQVLDADFALAQRLNIRLEQLPGKDVAQTLADYARQQQVTQIVLGHSEKNALQEVWQGSLLNKLLRLVRGIDVLVISNHDLEERAEN